MLTLLILIIIPIAGVISLANKNSKDSNVVESVGLEFIYFVGGWIATVSLVSFSFRFIENTEWGLGNIFYFFFVVVPTAVFYPGIYSFVRDYSNNRLIVLAACLLLTPLLVVSIWGGVALFGGSVDQQ